MPPASALVDVDEMGVTPLGKVAPFLSDFGDLALGLPFGH